MFNLGLDNFLIEWIIIKSASQFISNQLCCTLGNHQTCFHLHRCRKNMILFYLTQYAYRTSWDFIDKSSFNIPGAPNIQESDSEAGKASPNHENVQVQNNVAVSSNMHVAVSEQLIPILISILWSHFYFLLFLEIYSNVLNNFQLTYFDWNVPIGTHRILLHLTFHRFFYTGSECSREIFEVFENNQYFHSDNWPLMIP